MNRVTKGDLVQPETGIRETGAVETDRRYKILVIEDDEDIQVLLTCLLRDQGYDVETASDGGVGLYLLDDDPPDLILLDIAMPAMDGLEFLRRRSRRLEHRDIPVIVLSARDRNKDVMVAIELGAEIYMTKPFDNRRLLESVRNLLPRREGGQSAGSLM